MKLKTFVCGSYMNNCYVLNCDNSKEAVVIDPGDSNYDFEKYLISNQLIVKYVILTHGHSDHTGGLQRLQELFPELKIVAGKKEAKLLLNKDFSFSNRKITADINVLDNDELDICGIKMQVIETPGHTAGGICLYIKSEKMLFSGDTLFLYSIGRTDLPTGNYEEIIKSIKEKLFVLPDDTRVLPGHDMETFIGKEKLFNAFVS